MAIPVKNPNISTNRYKELLWFEKEYKNSQELCNKCFEENKGLKDMVIIMENYFELICNLGYDYDGYNTVEGLKSLIDEMSRLASLGRACDITEPIYESGGQKLNIIGQEVKGDSK